ncbi:MAG TPA: trigger factor [Candidatus Krumholzibacteria bacterium]|nr:trigger factor [Candidatus Krumholzibacteria bacterium]
MTNTDAHDHDHEHDHHDHDHDHAHHDHDHHHHHHGPERAFTVTVASPSQTRRVLSVQVPAEELEKERAAVLQEMRRRIRVPGFRKGKVPAGFLQKNYADAIQSDAVRNLLPDVYEQALHREHIHPLGDPVFENVKLDEGGVAFDVKIDVRPEVTLSGYDKVSVEVPRRPVTDQDVDQALDGIRERLAAFDTVTREATPADHLVIDYVPLAADGTPEEKSRAKDYPVSLASDSLLAEFREGLVGMKAGEEKEIKVTYPADFGDERVAGTERTFRVQVKEVKEKLLPELDDNFAKRVDETAGTLLELKIRIRKQLEQEEETRYRRDVDEKIIDAIIAGNPFEVPEVMVSNYLDSLVEEDRRQHGGQAGDPARETEIREVFRDSAVRMIQKYFVMDAVKRQEKIELSAEDVDQRVQLLAQGLGKPPEEIRAMVSHPERRRGFESDLVEEKTMRFLRDHAVVKSP